jgi:1-acyl-sn-glycerol-3-phosphate acyltransferase
MLSAVGTHYLAVAVLVGLGLTLCAWLYGVYRRIERSPGLFFFHLINLFMARVLWRAKVIGKISDAEVSGAVIVCNHIGPIDPAFVALASHRPVHWMVASEYFSVPVLGSCLRTLGAIPTNRGGVDIGSTKLAIRYASKGDLVGMFPEGRINDTGKLLLPARPGAALVALKARVPVIPCYITGAPYDGTEFGCFFMWAKTTIIVGRPLDISEFYGDANNREVQQLLTMRFMREIARLGGDPDYEPTLAGRHWKPQPQTASASF